MSISPEEVKCAYADMISSPYSGETELTMMQKQDWDETMSIPRCFQEDLWVSGFKYRIFLGVGFLRYGHVSSWQPKYSLCCNRVFEP